MKLHTILNLAFGAIASLLASCSQDDAVKFFLPEDQEQQNYTLYLDAEVPFFDSVCEGSTRASGNHWEDGDVIYVTFSNDGHTVVSEATYKSSLGSFQFTSSSSLYAASDKHCSVYYFRGGTSLVSSTNVTMDKFTAIFRDNQALYSCSSNVVTLHAAFKPYTWRLCFKGAVGTQVKVDSLSSIVFNTSLDLITGSFISKKDSATLVVQSDGFTPYIYGVFRKANNMVRVEIGDDRYSRKISSSMINIGESGYFTVPTDGDLHGWTQLASYSGTINGYEYVDLGLPSGTLWATCNIGASKPEEYGCYYAWGEIEEKDYYNWSTYQHSDGTPSSLHNIGNDIAGTQYDVAHVKWGGSWTIPSIDQIKELISNCTWKWITQNGVNGTLVIGPNGLSIFFPAAGVRWIDGSRFEDEYGYYWSSSLEHSQVLPINWYVLGKLG